MPADHEGRLMVPKTLATTCIMDCPDTCALEVSVEGGKVQTITGSPDHSVTNGFICDKVRQFGRRVHHPDRLLHPMHRAGAKGSDRYVRISWDEAIGEIAKRLKGITREWGGEAILPYHYGGSNGLLSDGGLDALYFTRLGASRLDKTICAAPTTQVALGMYGKMPGVPFEAYPSARTIIIWGANPKASNIHLVPYLREAKRNGAFIAVVDPWNRFSDNEIDLHLPVLPGADLPLALAMIRLWHEAGELDETFLAEHAGGIEELLEQADRWTLHAAAGETGVPAEDIETLARAYADGSPAVIRCGWGLERNRNGGQAVAAILAMPALMGKFGVLGGGYTMSNSGAVKLDTRHVYGDDDRRTRVINMTRLGEVLTGDLDPPVKGLFVYNCNPAVTVPDQNAVLRGLAREDLFTVVFEQVMTDTARYADILLPATTFLEQHDIRVGYGNYVVGGIRPVIDRVGEAKPNDEVFALLARAMGYDDAPFTWDSETHMQKVADAVSLEGRAADVEALSSGHLDVLEFPDGAIQLRTIMPRTHDGKIHLTPSELGPRPYHYESGGDAKYPLALISPANTKMVSSTLGEFNYPTLAVSVNPADAKRRRIVEGETVRVFNELGEVVCQAQIDERVREGVVSMPKGAWRKSSMNGMTSTALCPTHLNVVGGGACFNDARVEVASR